CLPQKRAHLSIWLDLLILDAMSFRIIMHEWFHFYQHPDSSLPQLAITFRDYALNEQALREREALAFTRDREYWSSRLPTLPPAPELCIIQQSEELARPSFLHQAAVLDTHTWSCLKMRATRAGITPAMV